MIGRSLLFLAGWWCFTSCHKITSGDNAPDVPIYLPPVSHPIDTVHRYAINPFTGDSIKPIGNYFQDTVKTGAPVFLDGKVVSMDSLPAPEKVIVKGTTAPWYSNLHYLTNPTSSFSIDEHMLERFLPDVDSCHCPLINTYGDTLPMGQPVKIPLVYQPFQVPKSSPALPPRMRDNARFDIQYLDLDEGMKSLSPGAIMEDKGGTIWMAVNDVSQFDGAGFRHFSNGEGTRLTHVQSMMVDSKGRNWFCGAEGIFCTDGSLYFNLSAKNRELYRNDIKALVEDHAGNIWLGARQGVVSRLQFIGKDTAVLTHYTLSNHTNEAHILSALVDSKGNVWFGTDRDGLFRYNGKIFTHFNDQAGIPSPTIAGLCEDHEGNIWIGTDAGLCRYSPKSEPAKSSIQYYTEKEGLSSNHIKTVLTANDGTLWLATWTGGVDHIIPPKINGETWYCEHYTTEEGLSTNTVRTIMQDRTGNIWICPDGAGVHILKPNSFQHISDLRDLTELNIVRMMRDRKQNIWFGTEGPGLHMLEPATASHPAILHHYQLSNDPRLGWTRAILEDNDGNIWFGGKEGFWKMKPQANYASIELIHYSFWAPLAAPWVISMTQDPQGNFWMATYGGGVVRWKPDGDTNGTFVHYSEYFGFSCDYLTSIAADQDGNIWIGTDQNGITELQPSANGEKVTMMNYTEREGLASNFIIDMQQDAASNFWIATNWNGAFYFEVPRNGKPGRCTSYATTQGLSSNEARSVFVPSLPGLANQVWVSTTNGINLIRTDSMNPVVRFQKAQGLKIPSFEAGSVEEAEQGFLWWGSEKGIGNIKYQSSPIIQPNSTTSFTPGGCQ
jgi:ligand-binding sensor domain-containing protein